VRDEVQKCTLGVSSRFFQNTASVVFCCARTTYVDSREVYDKPAYDDGMKELLLKLLKLQAAEFDKPTPKITAAEIAEIRASVPPTILGHYDRLVARGKRGVAIVRNQVCTGCHMRLPIGTINTLMQGTDIQLCDTCGRYLWLEETPVAPEPEPVAPAKPAAKAKRRKKVAHAAA